MGKLFRSSSNRVLGGVCAGVAEYFGWNVGSVRLIWLVLSVLGAGSPVLFYLILALLMPSADNQKESYEERMNKRLGK